MKATNAVLATATIISLLSCNDVNSSNDFTYSSEKSTMYQDSSTLEFSTDRNSLTNAEKEGLILMREEEKLAADVYLYFYDKYQLRPFFNINKSEIRHTSAVLRLLNYFGINDPATAETGKFSNKEIQQLYDQLTTDATTSELALSTGAFIEEYDIADLRKLMNSTRNTDILKVYSNLLNGSYNHIKAFTRVLKFRKITYSPQILTSAEYNKIVSN